MDRMFFRVRGLVVLVSLLLILQSFRVSQLGSRAGALGADPTVSLDPSYTRVPVCENFTLNVTCSSVQDLYSWKLNMTFNSTYMECVNFEEGPFLNQSRNTKFVPPVINNTDGTITGANCSVVGASSGVSGTGTLANATFHCKDVVGQSTVYVGNIELYNSTGAKIYSGTCSGVVNQIPTVTFRLLAVEKTFQCNGTQFPMRSAEYLIQNLIGFKNWQNGTWADYNYRAYIHLLSNVSTAELSGRNMLKYYRGDATKTSILNEITTFLNDTGPGESNDLTVRIFYYDGHGGGDCWTDKTDPRNWINRPYHFLDLGPPWHGAGSVAFDYEINETELDQALNSGDLASSNCTLVILDTCTSGGFVTDLTWIVRLGRVIITATTDDGLAYGCVNGTYDSSPPTRVGNWSWFTGNRNATCDDGSAFGPLGIIGGLFNTKDANNDGWRSAGEVFTYAQNTTKTYSESLANGWNETTYNDSGWENGTAKKAHPMNPTISPGALEADIPLVMWSISLPYTEPEVDTPFCYNAVGVIPGDFPWPGGKDPYEGWPMFGNGPDRGRVSLAGGAIVPNIMWTCSTLSTDSSAAVVDGVVFVAREPSSVCALALTTGRVIWTFSAGGAIHYSSPAVVDGFVFIGTMGGGGGAGGGWLYALDEYTGRVRWKFQVPSGTGIISSPAVADGRVFIATVQNGSSTAWGVYALNETSGASIWNFTTTTPVQSSPTCANGRVFFGTLGAAIYALNASTTNPSGQQLWNYTLSGNNIISTVAADSGSIYVSTIYGGAGGGRVYAFNQFTGLLAWPSFFSTTASITGSPAVDTGRNLVLIGSDDGEVYALHRATGSPVWSTYIGGPISMSSAAVSNDGLIYIGSTNGNLTCLNETNYGARVWSCLVGGSIRASPALTDQHVIIGSMGSGSVECIGPPFPVNDTAVCNVTVLLDTVIPGQTVVINCTVANNGDVQQTFQVTFLYNNTVIHIAPTYVDPRPLHTETVTLLPKTTANIVFTWNTTGFAPGSYTISAIANPVPGEINTADNTFIDGTIQILQISISGGGGRTPYID